MINIVPNSLIVLLLASLSAASSSVYPVRRASEEENISQGLETIATGDSSRDASSENACKVQDFQGRHYLSVSGFCLKAEVFSGGTLSIDNENGSCTEADASNSVQVISAFESFADNEAVFNGDYTYSGQMFFTGGAVTEVTTQLRALQGTVFKLEVEVPACIREAENVDNPCTDVFGDGICPACTGDCDYDSDCAGDMRCFERSSGETDLISGCVYPEALDTLGSTDICFSPPDVEDGVIHYVGECNYYGNAKCGLCQGDCDEDYDCEEGLVCIQRDVFEEVPGCTGHNETYDYSGHDVCGPPPPTISPAPTTTAVPTGEFPPLQYVANPCTDVFGLGNCPVCTGDCDYDSDCEGDLKCFERNSFDPDIPGCSWSREGPKEDEDTDYCFSPPDVEDGVIHYVGECNYYGNEVCGLCQGDCDKDSDCEEGLACIQRDGFEQVLGCTGHGGIFDISGKDVCSLDYCNINVVAGKTFFLEVADSCLKVDFNTEGSISVDNLNTNCTMEGESSSITAISFLEESFMNNRAVYKGTYNGEIYITQDQSITEVMPLFQGFTGPNGGFVLQVVLPSCIQEIQDVANPCTDYFGAGNCHICTGDCDYDSDCAGDLKCFERYHYDLEEVPGCIFTDFNDRDSDTDYCFLPPNPAYGVINYVGECGYYDNEVCGLCQGDCDEDSDCEEGLVCIERDGFEEVLGCTGQGGMYDYPTQDVCILDYCEINGELEGTYFLVVAGVCLKIEFFAEGTISVDNSNPSCTEAGASSSISIISTLDSFTNNGGALYKGTNSGEIYFTQDLSETEITPKFKGFTGPNGGFVLQVVVPYCPSSQSAQPSGLPSPQPSPFPTARPSKHPSRLPSPQPSPFPTARPSKQPSRPPSPQPSPFPTARPSKQPSHLPSPQPSPFPTARPSKQPSRPPTPQPSPFPTARPSKQPSRPPTPQPSPFPTARPSKQPSRPPSPQPSPFPTARPSKQPSRLSSPQPSPFQTAGPSKICPEGQSFSITLINTGTNNNFDTAFANAKARWESIIKCDLSDFGTQGIDWFNSELSSSYSAAVDDVVIGYEMDYIDGLGTVLGFAGPRYSRSTTGSPISGIMKFDEDDFAAMSVANAEIIILHEMGHVLGLVNILNSPCKVDCSVDATYSCPKASAEYSQLGLGSSLMVDAASCGHWSESTFPQSTGSSELMTPYFEENLAQPITRVSIAALEESASDYVVDYNMANSFPYNGLSSGDLPFKALAPDSTFNLEGRIIRSMDPIYI